MKLKITSNFSFRKLLDFVKSDAFPAQKNKILGSHVAESSKRFIMQGKVKPSLAKETIKSRMKQGYNTNTPLFRTGTLANSLKVTKKGIEGAKYGKFHLKGDGVPQRNFIAFEEEKIKKPLNTLVKKMEKAMKK